MDRAWDNSAMERAKQAFLSGGREGERGWKKGGGGGGGRRWDDRAMGRAKQEVSRGGGGVKGVGEGCRRMKAWTGAEMGV